MKIRILSILLFAVQVAFGQIYIDSYRFAQPQANLLLDDYPGAEAAYSLRKLDKDYTGSAIEIQRVSPAGTTNIGFDSNGDLDVAAINTYCSGTTCYVSKWYDQSGNNNTATATVGNQPVIYAAGSIITEGGKPAMDFDGSNDYFDLTTEINVKTANTSFLVSKRKASNTLQLGFGSTDNSGRPYSPFVINNIMYFSNANPNPIYTQYNFNNNNRNLITGDDPYTTYLQIYINGSLVASSGLPDTPSTIGYTQIGARLSRSNYSNSITQELILYLQSKTEDGTRSDIEDNINSYYSIY